MNNCDVPSDIPVFKAGDTDITVFSADVMNTLGTVLRALRNMEIEDMRPTWSEGKLMFSKSDRTRTPESEGTSIAEIGQFELQTEFDNHLVCKRVTKASDGTRTTSGDSIRIAKPDELMRLGWNGETVNGYSYVYSSTGRTATLVDGSVYGAEEVPFSEEVFPPYIERRTVIYAARIDSSAIAQVEETVLGVTTQYSVQWVDLNAGGRTWQPAYRKVKICIEGATGPWWALVRASNAFQEAS